MNDLIHFIWVGPQSLGYVDYLAVKTAAKVYEVVPKLWIDNTVPDNMWLSKIQEVATLESTKDRGGKYEWWQVANGYNFRANYLRLQLLRDFGGLYLDTDTLCVKSIFDLELPGLVIGNQGGREPLNNAVMYVAEPQHVVVKALLEATIERLEEFRALKWSELGPQLLTRVIKGIGYRGCTVLPKEYFYFYKSGRYPYRLIFEDALLDDRVYIIHWWNSMAGEFARKTITPEYVRDSNSLYATTVRKVLGDDY